MTSQPSYRARRLLPNTPAVSRELLKEVRADWNRLADAEPVECLTDFVSRKYQLDLATEYAGIPVSCPWGKASGQLSMNAAQVRDDVEAGLGFVVLKTVIAEDARQTQSMAAWAIRESRMLVEPITGASGESGWTVSWKGRGWWHSFDDYLQLIRDARRLAAAATGRPAGTPSTLIVPSCKYHLPSAEETAWKTDEYEYTTARLLEAWHGLDQSALQGAGQPATAQVMPLEKDFSPTLAGSDRAAMQSRVLDWLREVPRLIHDAASRAGVATGCGASSTGQVKVGLKLFNALFDDEFQVEMLRTAHLPADDRADFLVYGNRLFDPEREFDGQRGIAYGGPDLLDRNLRVLDRFLDEAAARGESPQPHLPWSATGNMTSGRTAVEYALRGATTFQLHTFCQLPSHEYRRATGSRTQRALHELYLHPEHGLVVWMHHLAGVCGRNSTPVRFCDVPSLRSLLMQ